MLLHFQSCGLFHFTMPPRPFNFPLSVGIDICNARRFAKHLSLDGAHPKHLIGYLRRILTRRERVQYWERYGRGSVADEQFLWTVANHLAGR